MTKQFTGKAHTTDNAETFMRVIKKMSTVALASFVSNYAGFCREGMLAYNTRQEMLDAAWNEFHKRHMQNNKPRFTFQQYAVSAMASAALFGQRYLHDFWGYMALIFKDENKQRVAIGERRSFDAIGNLTNDEVWADEIARLIVNGQLSGKRGRKPKFGSIQESLIVEAYTRCNDINSTIDYCHMSGEFKGIEIKYTDINSVLKRHGVK